MEKSLAEDLAAALFYMDEDLPVTTWTETEPEGSAQLSDVAPEVAAATPFVPTEPSYLTLFETVRTCVEEVAEDMESDAATLPSPWEECWSVPSASLADAVQGAETVGADSFSSAVIVAETIQTGPAAQNSWELPLNEAARTGTPAPGTLTPTPIHVEFSGDINREVDLDALLDRLENRIRDGLFSGTDLSYSY